MLDDQIIAFYSKGRSIREFSETIKELYDVDVSATLISNVTERGNNEVIQWKNKKFDITALVRTGKSADGICFAWAMDTLQ